MSCRSIRPWLHVERGALDEADRLLLEAHLQRCERCRMDRERLALVHRLGAALPAGSIGPRGYQRAIARALMEGAPAPQPVRGRARWWALAAAAGAAAALAALLAIRSGGAGGPGPGPAAPPEPTSPVASVPDPEVRPPAPPPAPDARAIPSRSTSPAGPPDARAIPSRSTSPAGPPDVALVEGTLIRGGEALPSRVELPANVALRAGTRARVLVHGVSVVIAASSQIRWRAPERVLVLEAGTVQVDGGPVRIATDQFRVDASGAATITARTVSVQRGSARVTGADGSVSRVPAGASWRVSEPPPMKPSAGRLLAQARAAFAARDHAAAERHADAALDAGPSRAQAAEARTILAESAHAAGRLDEALRRYEAIASRFGDLPAGETALFAAARLEGSRDRTDAARALFERYLERYPSGRFAGEARRRTRAPADQE